MVNPGAFRGKRKEFMIAEQEGYFQGVQEDHAAEVVASIVRHYFKRFPIWLSEDVEPSDEDLACVDGSAPDPEISVLSKDGVEASKYKRLKSLYDKDMKKLTFKKQVSRLQ